MQQIRVDPLDTQVPKRTGERLLDLDGDWGAGIVGQAMVLAASERELGLQEEVLAHYQPLSDRRRDRASRRRLVVMASLIGGVEASKSTLQRQLYKMLCLVLLPSGSVEKSRHLNPIDRQRAFGHRILPAVTLRYL
jgi:hypothetical protein